MKNNIVAIIQARMSATRLPGKVLMDIVGEPMLWHIVNRLQYATLIDNIVIATTTNSDDLPIVEFARDNSFAVFRGSEDDVLDRFYQAAKEYKANVVARITGDCPLIDPEIVDKVVSVYLGGKSDYVTNALRYTYPDGLDVEVFSFAILEQTWREAKLPGEREHLTRYMRQSGLFEIANVENDVNLSYQNYRWTVDEPSDLKFVREVYARLYKPGEIFYMDDVLNLTDEHPEIWDINRSSIRNEGYYLSLIKEGPLPVTERNLTKSQQYRSRAEKLIPSCTQTFSKGPSQYVQGVAPVFLQRGEGCHVFDVDGNEYIDYPMALGPVILGYNYPAVNEALIQQVKRGPSFTLPHALELELAELLVETIPCAEMVRYGKNGSDATAGAIRAARAFTGRDKVACCGYHGWQDWYIATTTRRRGVPQAVVDLTLTFEYNKIETLERLFQENPDGIAAVILEPIGVVEPQNGFLQEVKILTHQNGAVLIFDEIVTGFRIALGGAQEYFGVIPDLAAFGKAMANGYPISAVVGKREIMEIFDEIFFSFTFGGEAVSLAASIATIQEIKTKNVIEHIWNQGEKIKDGYNVMAREFGLTSYTECIGLPPHTVPMFKEHNGADPLALRSLFQQEAIKRGILFGGHNPSFSHSDADIEKTLRAYKDTFEILAQAIDENKVDEMLEGEKVQPIFRLP
jgi:glutamate-1-semialdehyde aminotransferase/spore coat polysaccharide biosynthesis protein SpsF (cytidylyltransferase family)